MDFSDERFHRKKVPWRTLVKEGVDPRVVMLHAQRQGLYKLAESARSRVSNERRKAEGGNG
tara:strand:+ start:338 stop:520 length:183 start_codon:yes stop_codon:yes gene_type:complete